MSIVESLLEKAIFGQATRVGVGETKIVACPHCRAKVKIYVNPSLGPANKPLMCPYCGKDLGVKGINVVLVRGKVTCSHCGAKITYTYPEGSGILRMPFECPVCGHSLPASFHKGTKIVDVVKGTEHIAHIMPVGPGVPLIRPPSPATTNITALQSQLTELQQQIAQKQNDIEQRKKQIQELEAQAGMTAEDRKRLADIDNKIQQLSQEVASKQAKVDSIKDKIGQKNHQIQVLQAELDNTTKSLSIWQQRLQTAQVLRAKWQQLIPDTPPAGGTWESSTWGGWGKDISGDAKARSFYKLDPEFSNFKSVWDNVIQIKVFVALRRFRRRVHHETHYGHTAAVLPQIIIPELKYDSGKTNSKIAVDNAFQKLIAYAQNKIYSLQKKIGDLNITISTEQSNLSSLQNQLSNANFDLESTKRLLNDTIASKERAELEIRRAIALRQAELDAARKRLEMELRLMDQLKASEEMLKAQIEAAKQQAILEAAKQREEILKAEEAKRLEIAQKQREEAEKKADLATAQAIVATKQREDLRQQALKQAELAAKQAEQIAKQREEVAKQIAQAQANLQVKRAEVEEKQKQVEQIKQQIRQIAPQVAVRPAVAPVAEEKGAGIGIAIAALVLLMGLGGKK